MGCRGPTNSKLALQQRFMRLQLLGGLCVDTCFREVLVAPLEEPVAQLEQMEAERRFRVKAPI